MGRVHTHNLRAATRRQTTKERAAELREKRLAEMREQVEAGQLRVRKMTAKEQRTGVVQPRPLRRRRS